VTPDDLTRPLRRPAGSVVTGSYGVLVEVTRAVAGDSPADEELAVLSRALDGTIPGVPGSVVAGALTDAANPPSPRDLPAGLLKWTGSRPGGDPGESKAASPGRRVA
jgi:hypothetical protein